MTTEFADITTIYQREQRRIEAIERMNQIMAGIADEETHPVVREQLIQIICEVTGYQFGFLAEVQLEGDDLAISAIHGDRKKIEEAETLIGLNLTGFKAPYDPQFLEDFEAVERFTDLSSAFDILPESTTKNLNQLLNVSEIVVIQLRVGNDYLGIVSFVGTSDQPDRDFDLLKNLCQAHLVYGIRLIQLNAWRMALINNYLIDLEEQVKSRTQALESSFRVSRHLASIINRDELMQAVVREVSQTFGYYHVQIYLLDAQTQILHMMAGSGEIGEILLRKKHALPLGKGLVGQAASNNEPVLIPNVLESTSWVANRFLPQTKSEIAVPITLGSQVLGVIDVQSVEENGLGTQDLELLQSIADQVAVAVRNAGVFSNLKQERDTLDEQVRETEEKAQASEARLQRIVATAMDGIIEIDQQGRVILWNEMATKIFGWNAENIIGRTLSETIVPSSYRRSHERGLNLFQRTGNGPVINRRIEITAQHKEGHHFPIELSITPIYLNDRVTFSGFVRDITERKQFEEEITRAKEEAEAAANAKTEFLANMSHEIRTPLNAIIGLTSLLLEMPHSPQQGGFLNTIRTSGDNLLTLLNDILDFSKIDAGKIELEYEEFSLYTCLDETFDQLASRAAQKEIELGYFVEPDVPRLLLGDVTRLRQVLVNLMSNAVKFTENGEVTIQVAVEEENSDMEDIKLRFDIHDTGIGVPLEQQQHLFEAFSQGDASTTRKFGGTGLGLAISKQLVELMGGEIWMESVVNVGSTFSFTVTLSHHHDEERSSETNLLNGRRALIIGENETNRRLMEYHMQSWGITTTIYEHSAETLARIGDLYDVILIDTKMSEIDGLTMIQEIKQALGKKELPILLITSMWDSLPDIASIPVEDRLYKPLKPTMLHHTLLRRLINYRRSSEDQAAPSGQKSTPLPQKLRILLGEDNAVNQKVVANMLKHLGLRADIASNGIEVVRATEIQRYDVILMDVQMPEMDGVLATQEIRKQYPAAVQPYIIALTANALIGDREKYLQSGMNDYISKPIKLNELRSALQRSLEYHRETVPVEEASSQMKIFENPQFNQARRQVSPFDLSTLYQMIGVEDYDLAAELIDLFISDSNEVLKQMRASLKANDLVSLGERAHTLKGSSASIGASLISQLASEMEPLKKGDVVDYLPQRIAQIEEALNQVTQWWSAESAQHFQN